MKIDKKEMTIEYLAITLTNKILRSRDPIYISIFYLQSFTPHFLIIIYWNLIFYEFLEYNSINMNGSLGKDCLEENS